MIQRRQQDAHMRQIKLLRRRLRQFVAEREHAVDCGLVRHDEALAVLYLQIIKLRLSVGSQDSATVGSWRRAYVLKADS